EAEGVLQGRDRGEKEHPCGDSGDGEQAAHAVAQHLLPGEDGEMEEAVHTGVVATLSTRRPFSRCRIRPADAAAFESWVTITMVFPCSEERARSRANIWSAFSRSRSPV